MSLLDKVKAAAGIGGAQVEIVALEGQDYHWRDTVRGEFTLTGGSVEQQVDRVSARLVRHTLYTDEDNRTQDRYDHYGETTIATGLKTGPGTSQKFAFAVVVPDTVSITGTDAKSDPVTWFVQGVAHIHHAVDATGGQFITIHAPVSLERLAAAVERAAPVAMRLNHNHDAFGRAQRVLHYQFAPTAAGKALLDGVKLDVQEKDGQVIGDLEINPQEHSFADRLKALLRQDRIHHPISIPVAALTAGENGGPGPDVIAQLEAWFQPYQPAAG